MNQINLPKKIVYLLGVSIVVNLMLFVYIIVTTWRFDREIHLLEKKIELLEIHVFPENYRDSRKQMEGT